MSQAQKDQNSEIQRPTNLVPPLQKHVLQSSSSQHETESPDNVGLVIPR